MDGRQIWCRLHVVGKWYTEETIRCGEPELRKSPPELGWLGWAELRERLRLMRTDVVSCGRDRALVNACTGGYGFKRARGRHRHRARTRARTGIRRWDGSIRGVVDHRIRSPLGDSNGDGVVGGRRAGREGGRNGLNGIRSGHDRTLGNASTCSDCFEGGRRRCRHRARTRA